MSEREELPSHPVPSHDAPALGSIPAIEDGATALAFDRMKRRNRLVLRIVGGGFIVACGAAWLTHLAGVDALSGPLVAIGGILALALVVVAVTQPTRAKDVRRVRRSLDSPWRRVEVVVMAGAPGAAGRRAVVVLDALSGQPVATWLVATVRTPRWLVSDERQWAYLAVNPEGDIAALSPLDRSTFAILRTVGLGSRAVHEWAQIEAERWEFPPPVEPGPVVVEVTTSGVPV